jgi:hypothetical protein
VNQLLESHRKAVEGPHGHLICHEKREFNQDEPDADILSYHPLHKQGRA